MCLKSLLTDSKFIRIFQQKWGSMGYSYKFVLSLPIPILIKLFSLTTFKGVPLLNDIYLHWRPHVVIKFKQKEFEIIQYILYKL